jgi:hypothetical protein
MCLCFFLSQAAQAAAEQSRQAQQASKNKMHDLQLRKALRCHTLPAKPF